MKNVIGYRTRPTLGAENAEVYQEKIPAVALKVPFRLHPMQTEILSLHKNGYELSSDPARQRADQIFALLQRTHWGDTIDFEVLNKAIRHSLCFSIFQQNETVAFGRFVTDYATYAYLTDVVVSEDLRGQGLGRWLVEGAMTHPDLCGMRRLSLVTRNARRLYESLGFTTDTGHLTYMEKR